MNIIVLSSYTYIYMKRNRLRQLLVQKQSNKSIETKETRKKELQKNSVMPTASFTMKTHGSCASCHIRYRSINLRKSSPSYIRDMRAWLISSPHPIAVISDHKNLEYFMTSRILNRRQARWAMFLSEYNFKLDYAPGKKNPADALSRRPDLAPQRGDEVVQFQNKALLTNFHLDRLFPRNISSSPISSTQISALSTFNIDNSELLDKFKSAYQVDTEWRDALAKSNDSFTFQDNLVFHDNLLFVPQSLRSQIL
jgi:hypothetical protein